MKRWWTFTPEPTEGSWRLRLAVFANSVCAYLAYATIDPDMPIALPLAVTALGAWVSHRFRDRGHWLLKLALAFGMLYALYNALDILVRGAMDPRLALAQLLLWLQMLNSFDLPRRKNLRVALLVAGVLMVVAATLSRTIAFGPMLAAFAATLAWAEYEAFASELGARPARPGVAVKAVAQVFALVALVGLPLFALAPRQELELTANTLPMSINLPLPERLDARVRQAGMHAGGGNLDSKQRLGVTNFGDQLDLDVRSVPSETVVMRVKTSRPYYWRALAFDAYNGRAWRMSAPDDVKAITNEAGVHKLKKPTGQRFGQPLVQTFYLEQETGNLIFNAWTPVELFFPTSLIWRDRTDGLRSPLNLQRDMHYSVASETPVFDRARLEGRPAEPLAAGFDRYLALPAIPERTRRLAAQLTRSADTPYRKMEALTDYLRVHYPYRLDVPQAPSGREWVDFFLFEQRAGFCEHFATSLAVLGRLEGVPTRLVTGYLPGDYNPFTGFYEVKGKHAHAWVEAWMPRVGWVPFDATPASIASDWGQGLPPASPGVAEAMLRYVADAIARHLAPALGLAAVASLAFGAFAWLRHRRTRPEPATRHYRRVKALLRRHGLAPGPGATPGAWLAAARDAWGEAPALERFFSRYQAARFGGEAAGDLAGLATEAIRSVKTSAKVARDRRSGYKRSKREADC